MRGSKRMGIETVAKNNGERIIKKLWCRGGGIEVWRVGLSEHTKVVVVVCTSIFTLALHVLNLKSGIEDEDCYDVQVINCLMNKQMGFVQ